MGGASALGLKVGAVETLGAAAPQTDLPCDIGGLRSPPPVRWYSTLVAWIWLGRFGFVLGVSPRDSDGRAPAVPEERAPASGAAGNPPRPLGSRRVAAFSAQGALRRRRLPERTLSERPGPSQVSFGTNKLSKKPNRPDQN
jgi:hypothetical protein